MEIIDIDIYIDIEKQYLGWYLINVAKADINKCSTGHLKLVQWSQKHTFMSEFQTILGSIQSSGSQKHELEVQHFPGIC